MNTDILNKNTKEVILEATYQKVPFEVYNTIYNKDEDDIVSLKDLRGVLDKMSFEAVRQCVNEYFCFHMIHVYAMYLNVADKDPYYSDEFPVDWFY